jgi:hypothetical protein
MVTWRRPQMVLWSAQGMSMAQFAGLAFISQDWGRDVLRNFSERLWVTGFSPGPQMARQR